MSLRSVLAVLASSAVVMAANHDVQVGPGLSYTPSITTAAVGDTVTFHFSSNSHDVASGPFSDPCDDSDTSFYSGLDVRGRSFIVTVNNTDPIYYYCTVRGHCQGGMVGGINVQEADLNTYRTRAATESDSDEPDAVAGGVLVASGASASTAAPSTTGSGTAVSTASAATTATTGTGTSARASGTGTTAGTAASSSPTAASAGNSLMMGGVSSGNFLLTGAAALVASTVFWAGLV